MPQNAQVGEVVAHYNIHYSDGASVLVPVRERFEIAAIPMWWSALPFLAVPENQDFLAPRYRRHPRDGILITQLVRPLVRRASMSISAAISSSRNEDPSV